MYIYILYLSTIKSTVKRYTKLTMNRAMRHTMERTMNLTMDRVMDCAMNRIFNDRRDDGKLGKKRTLNVTQQNNYVRIMQKPFSPDNRFFFSN